MRTAAKLMLLGSLIATPAICTAQSSYSAPPRDYNSIDRLVSVNVFHWFTATGGQQTGPWRPVEGRANWTGEPDFWVRQIKDIMDAGIDIMYVHLMPDSEQQRINLFIAASQLRGQGYDIPRISPFLDPLITWSILPPIDLATTAGKDQFVAQYTRFFQQYFGANTDPYAESYLLHVNGKVVLNTWHCNAGYTNNTASLTRADVESRLSAAFGATYPTFNNGIYMVATPNGIAPSFADEKIHQFSNQAYYSKITYNNRKTAGLKGGYWDQNIRNPGSFLPRSGGAPFQGAWTTTNNVKNGGANVDGESLALPIYHVNIESWNEYDEGSGMYAASTAPPYIAPSNVSGNTDVWSTANNPREYIDTTAASAASFRAGAVRTSRILSHTLPSTWYPGQAVQAEIVVRNEGTAQWSNAANYKLGQMGPQLYRWTFDAGSDGWTLLRNAFGTSGNTTYENGDWNAAYGSSGGGLRTRTGGVDGVLYTNGASTAWTRTFHLDQSRNVAIGFKWRFFFPSTYESNEQGEARFELDQQLHGANGQTYLAHCVGGTGVNQDTGWQNFSLVTILSGPADHTIEIGGWNNRKNASDESLDVYVDEVTVLDVDAPPAFGPQRLLIDDAGDEISTYGGIFRGRPRTFSMPLTAPTTPGAYEMHFQMLQEGVEWFGERLDITTTVLPAAWNPAPVDGAANVYPLPVFSWSPGVGAIGHQLYVGTNAAAVGSATPASPEFVTALPAGTTQWTPAARLPQGVPVYWRVDELQSVGSPVKGLVWTFTTRVIRGDFDGDLDSDQADFGWFQTCLSGSGIAFSPGCERADFDADGDVDTADFSLFLPCMNGANRPPGC